MLGHRIFAAQDFELIKLCSSSLKHEFGLYDMLYHISP